MATDKDVEAHRPAPISLFHRIWDQGAVNSDIQNAHYAGSGTEDDPYAVSWLDHDPVNPMEYSNVTKWSTTMLVALATLVSNSTTPRCKVAHCQLTRRKYVGCCFRVFCLFRRSSSDPHRVSPVPDRWHPRCQSVRPRLCRRALALGAFEWCVCLLASQPTKVSP